MNAVEIEEAISALAGQPFDPESFPYAFLEAFGNKATTIKRLKSGSTNSSDLDGGVLQRNNIHIVVCEKGQVTKTLASINASPATAKAKAKFALATDGVDLEAEDLASGETVACPYQEFPNHFGFFLPLAGITTVKQIRNNPIDIQATGRLNRLYVELLKTNEDWASDARRHDMNQFMARLIFCFFAEDTDIFNETNLFTSTIEKMSDSRSDNTDHVIGELFRAMDTKIEDRAAANLPRWADAFPYVNGGLFAGSKEIPKFSRIARSYLLHAGHLNWQEINPDIFGSMIQAVADDEERGELGMHYTSIPNILKVLNPLFLDDLREQLDKASDNPRKLLNLRKRIANIRVFDPACGSGNFLVIAYIQMREIEAEILRRRGEANEKTWIKLENFYGIEIKDFAVEVARLSLLIAEFQCDVRFIGQKEAKALVLPLKKTGKIHQGNALHMDWLEVCSPVTKNVLEEHDFGGPTGRLALEETGLEGVVEPETYICGNPPYKGTKNQTEDQKEDIRSVFHAHAKTYKSLDYVAGWFFKASQYGELTASKTAFVSTNSICQGGQVPLLWPLIFAHGNQILFAHTSFLWKNLASHNAGVTVAIVGFGRANGQKRQIFSEDNEGNVSIRDTDNINAYLIPGKDIIVEKSSKPLNGFPRMRLGNQPYEGSNLIIDSHEYDAIEIPAPYKKHLLKEFYGSSEFIRGGRRYCLWITDDKVTDALKYEYIKRRVEKVRQWRLESTRPATRAMAERPHQFCEMNIGKEHTIIIPIRSSENREYLPTGLLDDNCVVSNLAYALYDAPIWCLGIIASRLHLLWIATVCGRMKSDYSYSNKMGWNTFPIPKLTEQNKDDLTRCAEDILLAREAHFPDTIDDLYEPERMPEDLRQAHDRNDDFLERIYIGRRFKNDTERLEKLFDMYAKMTTQAKSKTGSIKKRKKKASSK